MKVFDVVTTIFFNRFSLNTEPHLANEMLRGVDASLLNSGFTAVGIFAADCAQSVRPCLFVSTLLLITKKYTGRHRHQRWIPFIQRDQVQPLVELE